MEKQQITDATNEGQAKIFVINTDNRYNRVYVVYADSLVEAYEKFKAYYTVDSPYYDRNGKYKIGPYYDMNFPFKIIHDELKFEYRDNITGGRGNGKITELTHTKDILYLGGYEE